jgi:hypothetical protein
MVADGVDKMAYMFAALEPGSRESLIAGWRQLDEDVATYRHTETVQPVGAQVEGIGSLVVRVEGRVLSTNLDAFRAGARRFMESLPCAPETDQDFADCEAAVKACREAEDRIAAEKRRAMADASTIDELFRAVDLITEEIRVWRLTTEKAVKTRKEAIRYQAITARKNALLEHIQQLKDRVSVNYLFISSANFEGAIKGLKTISSVNDKLGGELARAKIEASMVADLAEANIKSMGKWMHLFPDIGTVCTKSTDDFMALLGSRVAQEERRIAVDEERRVARENEERARLAENEARMLAAIRQREAETTPPAQPVLSGPKAPETRADKVSAYLDESGVNGKKRVEYEAIIRGYLEWAK